jgi:hypothetical protein
MVDGTSQTALDLKKAHLGLGGAPMVPDVSRDDLIEGHAATLPRDGPPREPNTPTPPVLIAHDNVRYAPDGRYLGELQRDDHLITRIVKQPRRRRAFTPLPDRPARPTFIGFGGFPMPVGYEDFPDPDALR